MKKIMSSGQFKKGSNCSFVHGKSHTKIYYVWQAMRRRCLEKHNKDYIDYGGRGITFDKNWNDFTTFYSEMSKTYREGLELDRIDNNGNYCKANCRWADKTTQRNNKRNNHYFFYQDQKLTLAEWSRKLKINYSTLRSRVRRWGNVIKIFNTI